MERRKILKAAAGTAIAPALWTLPEAARAAARKVLVIASGQDITNFDPHVATGYSASMLLRNTYDGLVRTVGNPPKIVPHLASSWTVSPDGLEYVFKLDPTAKFHDGSPVTANAVIYSFQRTLRLAKGNAWMIAGVVDPKGIDAPDVQTVRFKLLKPFAPFLAVLPWQFVVNPALVEIHKGSDDGQDWLRKNIAGSGRFTVKRAEAGNLYEFERVPKPWKGKGNLDGAIWKIVRETATQRLMLEHGDVHIAVDLTSEDMDSLANKRGVVRIIEPEFRTFSIKMNTAAGPLADLNLRKAISYAFNYQAMLKSAGYADLMVGPLPAGLMNDPKLVVPRTDLKAAKSWLAKSKYAAGGLKLKMAYVSGLEQERQWSLVMLDSLKALGIDLDVRPLVWPDVVSSARSPETMPDFFPVYQTANYADPDNIAYAAYSSERNGSWQNPVYKNPKVDALIEKGRSERNPAKRAAVYAEFQRVIVADAPDIFGVLEKRRIGMRDSVLDFVFTPVASNAIELLDLSLK
ncbi:MAG: ABC transporter substrate-binding protein [Burkholderiales bacterium]|nr:ABC transporter substrate-binding protein [Burkholderiales bacterium]